MTYLPQNLHVLLIDDKISEFDLNKVDYKKYYQYFDQNLKYYFKKKRSQLSNFRGEFFIHYCDQPANLEKIFEKNKEKEDKVFDFPIDVILLDFNFEKIDRETSLGYSFLYEGKKYAGIAIYRYISNYKKNGISSIPLLFVTGEKIGKNGDIKAIKDIDEIENEKYRYLIENIKIEDRQNKEDNLKIFKERCIYKDNNWIKILSDKIIKSHNQYYSNVLNPEKTNHLLHRISKEIYFFQRLDLERNEIISGPIKYPKYKITLKPSREDNLILTNIDNMDNLNERITGTYLYEKKSNKGEIEFKIPDQIGGEILDYIKTKNKSENSITVLTQSKSDIFSDIYYYGQPKHPRSSKSTSVKFGGKDFKNRIFLAATPVTAFSGITGNRIDNYLNKICHLYNWGVGGIILKTVYYEIDDYKRDCKKVDNQGKKRVKNNEDITFDDIQDISVTRCYSYFNSDKDKEQKSFSKKLYNTGKTAKENIDVDELICLLKKITYLEKTEKENTNFYKDLSKTIILSLGSHQYRSIYWNMLFKKLFEKERNKAFDFIEVNARHAMRKISEDSCKILADENLNPYLFGVDEYFIPPDLSNFYGYWKNFENWVETIQRLGIKYKKYIMLKLPYRSDLNILISIVRETISKVFSQMKEYLEKTNESKDDRYGITAISVINTIKSPYQVEKLKTTTGSFSGDFANLPQTSGEGLKELRNITLYTLSNICTSTENEEKASSNLDISASGGIMGKNDIIQCFKLGAKTVQLSSNIILEGWKNSYLIYDIKKGENIFKESDDSSFYFHTRNIKKLSRRKVKFIPERCHHCGNCINTFYCDAIINKFFKNTIIGQYFIPRSPIIKKENCTGCGLCVDLCEHSALVLEYENALGQDFPKCPICSNNSERVFIYPYEEINRQNYKTFFCLKCETIFGRNEKGPWKVFSVINSKIVVNIKKQNIKMEKETNVLNLHSTKLELAHNIRIKMDVMNFINCEIFVMNSAKKYKISELRNCKKSMIKNIGENKFYAHKDKEKQYMEIILEETN